MSQEKKLNGLKKIKEGYLYEKNNEGSIMHRKIRNNRNAFMKNKMERLDDTVTI
jgi:hypothetical protein